MLTTDPMSHRKQNAILLTAIVMISGLVVAFLTGIVFPAFSFTTSLQNQLVAAQTNIQADHAAIVVLEAQVAAQVEQNAQVREGIAKIGTKLDDMQLFLKTGTAKP